MKQTLLRYIPIACFLILVVFLLRGLWLEPHHLPSNQIGKPLPDFRLPILGKPGEYLSSSEVQGKVVLLNIFASWCQACKDEQVFLMQLAHQGVKIYGINYKDNPIAARFWLKQYGNPYQKIGIDEAGQTAIDLGVYGTPETFLINKQGVIVYRHTGPLNAKVWTHVIQSVAKDLPQ